MKEFDLKDYLSPQSWGKSDLRGHRLELFDVARNALQDFKPLTGQHEDAPIQIIDFFSGAGGTSQSFAAINKIAPFFKFIGGCDINLVSATTYSRNYATEVFNSDIKDLAYTKGKLAKVLRQLGFSRKKPTILIGCAPCQGFSSHRKKHWSQGEDARNDLIAAFMEVVRYVNPIAVLMENVPEFLSGRYWAHFAEAKTRWIEMGYVVKDAIYNAASFGVPQERFRSIVLCMKKQFLLPTPIINKGEYRTVRQAIGSLPPVEAGVACTTDPLHKSARHAESTLAVIRAVPHDGGNRPAGIGPKCLDKIKGFTDVYGRLYWDRPSITITCCARNPASGRYTHPEQDRGLTIREVATLQSFPPGFIFTGKNDDMFRQIGEAVPPLLSLGVVSSLLLELLSSPPTKASLDAEPPSVAAPVSNSYSSVIAGMKQKNRKGLSK